MSKQRLEATFDQGDHQIKVKLTLLFWQEDGINYVYAPALDLTGYDYTKEGAKNSFEIVLQDFVSYTYNKNTIFEELERLGWTVNKKKKRVHAPESQQLLEDNETYREIINLPGVSRQESDVILTL